ncbi:MAG: cytochrome c3 family protein, partial [Desulfuromonadaceae bacterium]|nr:cytochrome c3 family protein [Desulfuromonadaceae bacterium]
NTSNMKAAILAAGTNSWSLGSDSVSLLCMSCHSLPAVGDLFTNTGGHETDVSGGETGLWGSRTGSWGSLSMSHPVGISYGAAQAEATATGLVASPPVTVPLFATNGVTGGDSMECGSCHAVHDPAYKPFLRMDNAGSALCVACHVK